MTEIQSLAKMFGSEIGKYSIQGNQNYNSLHTAVINVVRTPTYSLLGSHLTIICKDPIWTNKYEL